MKKQVFDQQFTIHPVGQGFFYSCTIRKQERVVFRMVFDCGSKTSGAGQEEVALYCDDDFRTEKILDLLVISHFDSDHVNHIHKLLEGGIKVKRLVMPLLTFEERIVLTLKMLEENGGYDNDLDYTSRLILDPVVTLSENMDNDSEVVIIESDPDKPIFPTDTNDAIEGPNNDNQRLSFEFPSNKKIIEAELPKGKVFKVKDSVKGSAVDQQKRNLLMEFLFYKKSIGANESKFFEKVKDIFLENFNIKKDLDKEQLLKKIVEVVKEITSSRIIRDIFTNAAKTTGINKKDVVNLNTTALCMLHINLKGIHNYLVNGNFEPEKFDDIMDYDISIIQKFLSETTSRITKDFINNSFEYNYRRFYRMRSVADEISFPNVFLTSDCSLLKKEDAKAILEKYKNYLFYFWLFQIPHHGSCNNSNDIIHSHIPRHVICFVNYGTQNKDKHPSSEVIKSLVVNRLSQNLISINEFQGLQFNLNLEISRIDE